MQRVLPRHLLAKNVNWAEYGYGLGFSRTDQSKSETESWDSVMSEVTSDTNESGSKSSNFALDFDNVESNPLSNVFGAGNASLRLEMYF